MSCGSCDCEECLHSRHMNDDEDDEEVPSIPFGTLPPPPPFHRTAEEFRVAMHSVFDQYPTARINMPAVVNIMMQRLQVKPHQWREAESQIVGYLKGQADAGVLNLTKGKNGGMMRNGPTKQVESVLQSATSGPAVNDHTCPNCGNTACSKSERSCWKCGNVL